ncbi:hypothetical protein [Mesorhizobium sp. BE184]|uniref:hypothetical protein n=1 Tax=Mesorhizobium sp. BE184 TaxID=2817714 RepID=UPI00285D3506|nr:hypothetical protein [Mesorhizobium sp. BE184]MDR7035034.1 hypothetical protein [Mesorhizobium sp. BE184]
MSVERVRQQMEKFLKSDAAEVLCIRGHWGTGKTYTWMEALKKAAAPSGGLAFEKYAYVSLFGQNSLEDVKRELTYQTVNRDRIGKEFDVKDLKSILSGLPQLGGLSARLINAVAGEGYSSFGAGLLYLTVRNRLVCLDDLERKGEGLRSVDVLGLISHLKEDRNCKVVLLLNDEQLEDRVAFDSFLEKVVDINLKFSPSPSESAAIALDTLDDDKKVKDLVKAQAIKLGIDNIRVIQKIFRTAKDIADLLTSYKPGVLDTVVKSIVLFGWAYHQPEIAPPLDYISSIGEYSSIPENPDPRLVALKKQWGPVLRSYGYVFTDEFDKVLIQGVINGHFDAEVVATHATLLHGREEAGEANEELDKVWNMFHASFDDNADNLVASFVGCVERNAKHYMFNTVVQVVDLLRRLERPIESDQAFAAFADAHKNDPGVFDLDRLARFGHELPEDILAKVTAIKNNIKPDLSNDELFMRLKEFGFGSDEATKLAGLPVEEYIRVLTAHSQNELQRIRDGLTDYVTVDNPNANAIAIMNRAADALKAIAAQNPLNQARARTWRLIQWQEARNASANQATGGLS